MKKTIAIALSIAAALCIFGCAKEPKSGANEANRRYFDAWLHVHYPDAKPTGLGIYIIEEEPGDRYAVADSGCAFVNYIVSDLEGNITSYNGKETAKQMGTYDTTTYYGPAKWFTTPGVLQAGVHEALKGMKMGGRRKVIIPNWLMSYKVYETEEEYLEKSTDGSGSIYDITVEDFTDDISAWELRQIGTYFDNNMDVFHSKHISDSLSYGFYYQQLEKPSSLDTLKSDTTIYINYTGKLLDGLVFDTTIEKVAKDNGLYKAGKKYAPVSVTMAAEYKDIKLGGNDVIAGFAKTLKQMKADEKGIGVFMSQLGYKSSGSGASIPGYAPLIFEIELTAKPEE